MATCSMSVSFFGRRIVVDIKTAREGIFQMLLLIISDGLEL